MFSYAICRKQPDGKISHAFEKKIASKPGTPEWNKQTQIFLNIARADKHCIFKNNVFAICSIDDSGAKTWYNRLGYPTDEANAFS